MILLAAALVELITVHMIDGRAVQINSQQITQLIHGSEGPNKVLVKGVHCVIRLTDSSFVSVAETCAEVEAKIGGKPL